VLVDPSIPLEDSSVRFQTQTISYYHSYGLWGRASNFTVLVPYAVATVRGTFQGTTGSLYRSGLADSRIRFSINLKGGQVMSPRAFAAWHEKSLLGFSFTALVPTGQYDPARLINAGTNRWGFKPEIGVTRRWGKWVLDAYAGVWFYTANNTYFPGTSKRTQDPVGAGEMHLTYYAKPRLWASLDGNFWTGGRSSVDGQPKPDEERDSRAGATLAIPLDQHQSIKFSYARGAYIQVGGNYRTISVAWQYSWFGKRE
jgi:hypothetical protein